MYHARAVNGLQRLGHTGYEHQHALGGPRAVAGDGDRQRGCRDVDRGQPGRVGTRVRVHDRRGEYSLHLGGDGDLAGEAPPELPVGGEFGARPLERHGTSAGCVGQIHRAHTARADAGA
ncbi:hypothetical protein UG55_1006189 [Frankia sp. EI5c]|nr:hypothetical protein UG55_1006189 [Frankia sp. EI5c]